MRRTATFATMAASLLLLPKLAEAAEPAAGVAHRLAGGGQPQPRHLSQPLAALDDVEHVERTLRVNREGAEDLSSELGALGIEVWPTDANFLLANAGAGSYERLLREGVITAGAPDTKVRFEVERGGRRVRSAASSHHDPMFS